MRRTAMGTIAGAFAALMALAATAAAQDFPGKAVTILVAFPPGSVIDTFSRLMAPKLEAKWKQSVIVENRPGGGGVTALDYMLRQPADGTIIAPNANGVPVYSLLQKTMPFDSIKDVAPITVVGESAYVLVTSKDMPGGSMKEFVAAVKAAPGKYNYGVVGRSVQMLDTIHFLNRAGIDMAAISYNGSAPANLALLKNEVQLYFNSYFQATAAAKEGTQKILGVASPARFALLPDTPTVAEGGVDFKVPFWYGMYASAKTPPAIMDRLSKDIGEVVMEPDFAKKLADLGMVAKRTTPQETQKLLDDSVAIWRETMRIANIQPE